jgi:hypothetical protein
MKPRTHNPNKHKPLKPIEIAQQRRVPLHKVANEGSKEEMAEFGRKWLAKTHDVKAYRAMLEAEKEAAGKDWNDSGKAWFWGRVEGVGE